MVGIVDSSYRNKSKFVSGVDVNCICYYGSGYGDGYRWIPLEGGNFKKDNIVTMIIDIFYAN